MSDLTNVLSRRRYFKWAIVFNYASLALAFVQGFLLMPLNLRFIPVALYGAYLASGNVLSWLVVVDPGLADVLQQRVANRLGVGDPMAICRLMWSGMLIVGVILVVFFAGVLAITPFLPSLLRLPATVDAPLIQRAFLWSAGGTAMMILYYTVSAISAGTQGIGLGFVFTGAISFGVGLQATMLYLGYGVLAGPLAGFVKTAILLVGGIAYLSFHLKRLGIPRRPRIGDVRHLCGAVSVTFFGRLVSVLSGSFDSFLVSRFLGPETVPAFRCTMAPVGIARGLVERPFAAVAPLLSQMQGGGDLVKARMAFLRLLRLTCWMALGMAGALLVLNEDLVRLWVGPRYYSGTVVNGLICLGLFTIYAMNVLSTACFALGRIKETTIAGVTRDALSLSLMFLGGWCYGLKGIVAVPVVVGIAFAAAYFAPLARRLLCIEREEFIRLLHDGCIGGVAVFCAAACVHFMRSPGGWVALGGMMICYAGTYMVVLSLLSKRFRHEAIAVSHVFASVLRSESYPKDRSSGNSPVT